MNGALIMSPNVIDLLGNPETFQNVASLFLAVYDLTYHKRTYFVYAPKYVFELQSGLTIYESVFFFKFF